MEEFAEKALEAYGISKLVAKQTGSTFMATAKGMNIAEESASDMAIELTGLSADMASFYNVSQDVASTALKSIFTGETETLKQFGIVMTETNLSAFALSQGINKNISAMSQAEKVQLRYQYVMSQTSLAQGDFARTSEGWANQTRILSEKWKELSTIIGKALKNIVLPAVRSINTALTNLINITESAVKKLAKMFGWDLTDSTTNVASNTSDITSSIEDSVGAQEDLTKAVKDTNKELNNSLAPFDELNVLQQDTSQNVSEGIGSVDTGSEIDLGDFGNITKKFEKAFEKADFKVLGKLVGEKLNSGMKSIKWNKIRSTTKSWAKNIANFLNGAIEEIDWFLAGTTIGNGIRVAIETAYTFLKEFDWKNLGYSIVDFAGGLFKSFDVKIPVSKFKKAIDILSKAFKNLYKNFLKPLAKWTIKKAVPFVVELLADAFVLLSKGLEKITDVGGISLLIGIATAVLTFKSCTTASGIISSFGTSIKLLGAALNAHPYVAIIAGIAGAITGLVTAVKLSNEQSWEALGFAEQAELMEGYVETITNCKDEINGLCEDITSSLSETSSDMMVIDDYKQRLEELLSKSSLTPEEQAELTTIGDYFCEKYPEFETAWNQYISKNEDGTISINGDLDTVKQSLTDIIDEYKRLASTSALSELAQENSKANVKSQKSLNNAAVAYKKAEKALEDFKKEWNFDEDDYQKYSSPKFSLYTWQSASGNNSNVSMLRKEYLELKNGVESAEKEFNSAAESTAQLKQNSSDLAKMQAVVNGNYEDAAAVLMAYQAGLINTEDVQKSQWKSISNLEKVAKESGNNLVFGLNNGVSDYLDEVKTSALSTADMYLDTLNGPEGFDINSPSKKTYKSGASLIEGLVKGVSDNLFAPVKRIKALAKEIIKNFDLRTAFESIWSGTWDKTKMWINTIISGIEWFVNRFVDSINGIIERINSVSGPAGEFLGRDWSFDKVPQLKLPRLATGTVVPASYGEFLAVLGDNKREPEVVSPLSTIKQAVAEAMAENSGSGGDIMINFTAELDGEKVFNKMIVYSNRYKKRHGKPPF